MKRLLLIATSLTLGFTSIAQNTISSAFSWFGAWCEGTDTQDSCAFSSTGTYNAGNVYSVELSDGSGSFASPTTLSSYYSSVAYPLGVTIGLYYPTTIPAGAGYRIRVVASDPVTIGLDNGLDIEIYALPTVTTPTLADICETASPITLTGGSPVGGSYSGTAVGGGSFNPVVAGVGSHDVTYTYTDMNGCVNSATEPIFVLDLPTVTLPTFTDLCEGVAPMTLTGGSPAGGDYSGTAVSGGAFDPTGAGVGSHNVTYTYTDMSGCTNLTSEAIVVNGLPTVTLSPFVDVCLNAAASTLFGGIPASGTYSGTGVSGGAFDPATAGVGSHDISYTYMDGNGCLNSATEPILVNDVPPVTLGGFANVCSFEASFLLTGESPIGGTFSGSGISLGNFDPAVAGVGTHIITYTFTDGNSCTNIAQETILVDACAGISENEASRVLLSPNPTEISFMLASDIAIDKVIVTDMNGRTVKTFGNQNSYNVAELNGGMYMVHISTGGLNLVKRLMVR